MENKNIIWVIGIIILLVIFGRNLGLFSTFSYEKPITFMDYSAIAYSARDFGTFDWTSCPGGGCEDYNIYHVKNDVSFDEISLSSSQSRSNTGFMGGASMEIFQTYIQTQDFNLQSSNLNKLEMIIDHSGYKRCYQDFVSRGGHTSITLISPSSTIEIFRSPTLSNRGLESTQIAGKLSIIHLDGNIFQLIQPNGISTLITLINETYELQIYSEIGKYISGFNYDCSNAGGATTENIKIYSLNIETELPFCNTLADTNCNGIVDRTELGVYINSWIAGSVTRDNLGLAIQAWVGGI